VGFLTTQAAACKKTAGKAIFMTGLAKQAKTLTDAQMKAVLNTVADDPMSYAMVLLSVRAGLRAKEIASLTWPMVCDAEGNLGDVIALQNVASKGKRGGRVIPMNAELRAALQALWTLGCTGAVIRSDAGRRMTANAVTVRFHRLYASLGFKGASSHSGRRTFITKMARRIVTVGGSLKDVQELAGHASLATTQRYIESNADAKRRAVEAA
jgi:integrase